MTERICPCGKPAAHPRGMPRCADCRLEKQRAYQRDHKRREARTAAERRGQPQRGDTVTTQCRWGPHEFTYVYTNQPRFKCDGCKKRSGTALTMAWAKQNPGQVREFRTRYNSSLKGKAAIRAYTKKARFLKYGMDQAWFDATLAAQGGRCATCRADKPGGRHAAWNIDHDRSCCPGSQSCGKCVRGLLCTACNQGLGQFKDDPAALRAAADYIERYRAAAA